MNSVSRATPLPTPSPAPIQALSSLILVILIGMRSAQTGSYW